MERFQFKYIIKKLDSPVFGNLFNVQELGSFDFGKTFGYYGNGKYFKTEEEAENYIKEKLNIKIGTFADGDRFEVVK